MKTNNKVEIDITYIFKNGEEFYTYTINKNFNPKLVRKHKTLITNAITMMVWNHVSRMVIYMPDDFVDLNNPKLDIIIIEEE